MTRHYVSSAAPVRWQHVTGRTGRRDIAGLITNAFSRRATQWQTHPIRKVGGVGTVAHDGYRYVPVSTELRQLTNNVTWVAEHRLVKAQALGRALSADEHVHHINGVRSDNRLENLELWSTSHPSGQRVEDLLEFCMVMLDRYTDDHSGLIERPLS